MENSEENMTDLKHAETRVAVGDNRTLAGTKIGDWNSYQRHDRKLHRMALSSISIIPGLHANIFRGTIALKKFPNWRHKVNPNP